MFTKPKNAHSLTHTIIWDILYCYSAIRCKGAHGMVAAVWSVFLRGAVLENHEEIPARTSTIRDCVDPRLSAALPFMTTIDQRSAVKQKRTSGFLAFRSMMLFREVNK